MKIFTHNAITEHMKTFKVMLLSKQNNNKKSPPNLNKRGAS